MINKIELKADTAPEIWRFLLPEHTTYFQAFASIKVDKQDDLKLCIGFDKHKLIFTHSKNNQVCEIKDLLNCKIEAFLDANSYIQFICEIEGEKYFAKSQSKIDFIPNLQIQIIDKNNNSVAILKNSFLQINDLTQKARICLIGDSLIDKNLSRTLSFATNEIYYNLGFSGRNISQILKGIKTHNLKQFDKAICLCGTNDFLTILDFDKFKQDYQELLNFLQTKINKIIVLAIFPVGDKSKINGEKSHKTPVKTNQVLQKANQTIKELCENRGGSVQFIDLTSQLINKNGFLLNEISDDGLHLNHFGCFFVSSLIAKELDK